MAADDFEAQFGAAREQFAVIEGGRKKKEPAAAAAAPANPGPSEDAVAVAFATKFCGRFAYDHTARVWMEYDGARWKADNTGVVFDTSRKFVREMSALAPHPALGKIKFAEAIERAARYDRRMALSHAVWDRDGWLLGVPGGVVNLRDGQLIDPKPRQCIRRQAAIMPAPQGTEAPLWIAFLKAATRDDRKLQDFLQRLCGYFLTGDVSEEMLTFIYGPGGNGKGVFLGAVTAIMGEYAVSVPIEVFMAEARINAEYYRAQMAGARLVTASETEAAGTWAEAQIKEMSGNETPLSGREPYGKPFTFRPQFKIAIVGNHAPKLRGRSPAMERRLRIIPFEQAPPRPDPDLKEKLRDEWPAILRWMIDGCVAWQRDRLGNADAIRSATSSYFEQQDAFGMWLEERCIRDKTLKTKPAQLIADFNTWAKENGEKPLSANEFAETVNRTPGLKREKSNGIRWVCGVGLKVSETRTYRDGRDD
jgi:putative DNA primase/helicase